MDDPWLNAWGEPQTSSKHITDDQDDISAPSWAQQEPDTAWDHSQNLWSSENTQRWSTPTFDSIAFAKPRTYTLPEPSETASDNEQDATHDLDTDQTLPVPESADSPRSAPVIDAEPPPTDYQLQLEPSPESEVGNVSRQNSPDLDGFGTFEAAADVIPQLDPWTPAKPSFPQEEEEDWGTSWKDAEDVSQIEGQKADEWEIAKRQKEIQDQYVPPELLGSILRQFDEFSEIYWGKDDSEIPPYQHNRNELADTMGIAFIAERLIPSDLSLPIPPVFSKTFISKEMIEALKLTKHHPVTRCGPFATYMGSKGSLTWEAAVKSKSDATEADVVPTGWRIIPKENTEQQLTVNENQKIAGAGLLSFFGRKSAPATNVSGSTSPINPSTPKSSSSRPSLSSPRPSTDGDTTKSLTTTLPTSSLKGADTTPTESLPAAKPPFVTNVEPAPSSMSQDESVDSVAIQPQSAVSRFFGRFSRTNRQSTANSRKSIALSSDDIEFLSDIVPSASEEMSQADQLHALSDMLNSPPVPAKLPPPLAPPPRPPPLSKTLSSIKQRTGQTRLFDLETAFSSPPVTSPIAPLASQPFTAQPGRLPPPLSPSTSNTPSFKSHLPPMTAPTTSMNSLFSDDDFADFQTPEMSTSSAPPQESSFGSTAFDDFDDFVSPGPPQVPNKASYPSAIYAGSPRLSLHTLRKPPVPVIPSLGARQSSNPHDRTASLLETAATITGQWPAPPSPLPAAIPPPSTSASEFVERVSLSFFDTIDETPGTQSATLRDTMASSTSSPPSLFASSPFRVQPHGYRNGSSNFVSDRSRSITPVGVSRSLMPVHSVISPPLPSLPLEPENLSPQVTGAQQPRTGLQQPQHQQQQQWKAPLLPSSKPLPSIAPPPGFLNLQVKSNRTGNGSPLDTRAVNTRQPLPSTSSTPNDPFTLFGSAPLMSSNVQAQAPANGSARVDGGGTTGKLSAQDLSFFEGL